MSVHQPVHQGVHQPYGGAVASGHLFINGIEMMNKPVHHLPVHQRHEVASGHDGGHPKPAENRHYQALSTIFLFNSKRRIIEKISKGYARAKDWWTAFEKVSDAGDSFDVVGVRVC
jgi:hypothetical protein